MFKKRYLIEKILFLPEVTDKIVFFSLIAINGMLKSHCDNLSTYHYHPIYHPCFDTQSSHEQTMQQYFRAVAIPSSKKASESDRAALFFCKRCIILLIPTFANNVNISSDYASRSASSIDVYKTDLNNTLPYKVWLVT